MSAFKPNAMTFDQGVRRVEEANRSAKFDPRSRITTSRDPAARAATDKLLVTNIPSGFKKLQLPLYFSCSTQLYVSIGAPDTEVPEHSHDEGDGLRYIVSGSVIYKGQELTGGDWMFIPAGKPYSLKVGPQGATMFYCYCCSCA